MTSQLITGYFLNDHARVHRASVSGRDRPTQLDRLIEGLAEDQIRAIPEGAANSIAWLVFHTTRCEDAAFNVVLAGEPQVFDQNDWQARTKIQRRDIGTEMTAKEVEELSSTVNIPALLDYRDAVGRRTEEIVLQKSVAFWDELVDPARLSVADAQGVVTEMAEWVRERNWNEEKPNAWFLWLATSHTMWHFGEARETRRIVSGLRMA
ncbi:MAG: DinB family protein [Dehalococcoidia bacterium]|nr:DinB family protein [Dehalococcoidia bacterium]